MSSNDLDRVRADLSTMRHALGIGLPWSEADTWFAAAIAAAASLYGVLSWPGSLWLVTSAWAAAPLAMSLVAYVAFLALKAHRLPPRDETRRREYKSTLVAMVIVIPACLALVKWATYAGLTHIQLSGCLLALMGATSFVVGVAAPPARYPRSYLIACALPLMVFGLLIPIAPASYAHSLIGLMGLVAMGLAAFITHRHVRCFREEAAEHVSH